MKLIRNILLTLFCIGVSYLIGLAFWPESKPEPTKAPKGWHYLHEDAN